MCEVTKAEEYPAFLKYNTFELHAAISDRLITFPLPSSSILQNEIPRHPKLLDLLSKRERRIVLYIEKEKEEESAGAIGIDENIENAKGGENVEFICDNENESTRFMDIDEELEEEYEYEPSCFEFGNFVAGESKEREKGVVEEELYRMTKKIILLEQEKQELQDEANSLRKLNQELESEMKNLREQTHIEEKCSTKSVLEMDLEKTREEYNLLEQEKRELNELNQGLEHEIKNLKEKFQFHVECSEKLKEKELEIEKLEKIIQKLESDNNSLTDNLTELTVQKITQSDLFYPFKVEKDEKEEKEEKQKEEEKEAREETEETEEKEEKKIRSMVRNIKNKSRLRKEDPNFEYPPLKIPRKTRTSKFLVQEDDDFQDVPAKKDKTIDVEKLHNPKRKQKKRWVLNAKKYPVIGLLDEGDKLLINKMQDYEGHGYVFNLVVLILAVKMKHIITHFYCLINA